VMLLPRKRTFLKVLCAKDGVVKQTRRMRRRRVMRRI